MVMPKQNGLILGDLGYESGASVSVLNAGIVLCPAM